MVNNTQSNQSQRYAIPRITLDNCEFYDVTNDVPYNHNLSFISEQPTTMHHYIFQNGYSASIIHGPYSQGIELAVLKCDDDGDYHITYDTPITDDVIAYIEDVDKLEGYLLRIQQLLPCNQ